MKYPPFLKDKSKTGICALSAGVGSKLETFEKSLSNIKKYGYRILETASVRVNKSRANTGKKRVQELNSLVIDKTIKAVILAKGGDYQFETLPYLDFELIAGNPKWYMGYSDATNLLLPITAKLDIPTIYGYNSTSFDHLDDFADKTLTFLKGNFPTLKSSDKHEKLDYYNEGGPILNTVTVLDGECNVEGRVIGGCLEAISDLLGTPYDYVPSFIERHHNDGFIWFFDIFSMNSLDVYRALLRMKYCGYFKNLKAVLVGRVCFENEDKEMSYKEAFKKVINKPVIMNMDIGHTTPCWMMINGGYARVEIKDGKGIIEYKPT